MEDLRKIRAERFRAALDTLGWSAHEVSRRLQCSVPMVTHWINNILRVGDDVLLWVEDLARCYDATPRPPFERMQRTPGDTRTGDVLAVLGWSGRELAFRVGLEQPAVRFWIIGREQTPPPVRSWLDTLAAFHADRPAPTCWRRIHRQALLLAS